MRIVNKLICVFSAILFANTLLAQTPEENKFQLAQSYEQSREFKEALRIYEEIYKTNKQEKYFEPIVRIYKQENRFQELLPFVEERIKTYPSAKNYILAGEIYWQVGQVANANSMWDKARKDYGSKPETYISIALTLNQLKQFEKTIPVLIEGKQKFPKNTEIIDALVKAYIFTNMYQDGFRETLYLYTMTGDLAQTQSRLYAMMTDTAAITFINNAFSKEIKKDENIAILTLYSWFLRSTKKYEEAFDIVIKIDNRNNSKGKDIFIFANESRKDEQFDIALKAYQYIKNMEKATPYYNNAVYEYTQTAEARLFQTMGNVPLLIPSELKKSFEPIIADYKRVIKDNPKTQNSENAKLRIATIERNIMKNNKAAIEMLNDIVETGLDIIFVLQATIELVDIYISTNELNKANELINNVLDGGTITDSKSKGTKIKGNAQISSKPIQINNNTKNYINEIKYHKAEILYYQGFIDSSLALYYTLLDSLSDDIVNDALARITFMEQNKEHIDHLSAFAKTEYLVFRGQYSDAIKGFNNIREIAEGETLAELSIIKIAQIETKQNNNTAAKTILTNYLAENAYPLYGDNALFLLGTIAEEEKNYIDAQQYFGDILYKYPRSIHISEARNRIRTIRGN